MMSEGKIVKCQHCKYVWTYHGEAKFYVGCPSCRYKIFIGVRKVRGAKNDKKEGCFKKGG